MNPTYLPPSQNAAIPNGQNMGPAYGGPTIATPPSVNTPTTVNAGSFGNVTPFNVPQGSPTSYGSFINSIQTQLPGLQQNVDQQQSLVDQQLQGLMASNTELGGRGAYQAGLESQFGVPETQKQIADLNTQLARRTAEYNTQYQAVEGQGYDQSLVQGVQALNRSKAAIELGNLASVQQALQGNMQNAISLAERTTNLKYEPLEAALKNKMLFYQENKEKLSSAQQRLAEKQNLVLQTQLKNIEEQKQDARQASQNAISLLKEKAITGQQAADIMSGKTSISQALAQTAIAKGVDPTVEYQARSVIDTIDRAIDNKGGIRAAVGPNAVFARAKGNIFSAGKQQRLAADIHQITGQLTLQNLVNAKANGATFGALSEGELTLLQQSASRLSDWEIKDKNGKPTGQWKVPEKDVLQELNKIKDMAKLDYKKRTGQAFLEPLQNKSNEELLNAIPTTSPTVTNQAFFQ